jgi:hypothetical protein
LFSFLLVVANGGRATCDPSGEIFEDSREGGIEWPDPDGTT